MVKSKKITKTVKSTKNPPKNPPKPRERMGSLMGCGSNECGQLGLSDDIFEKKRAAALTLTECKDVCCGGMHSVAVNNSGDVFTWGCNDEGALGRPTSEEEECFEPKQVDLKGEKAIQVSAGDSHTAALLANGRVFAWGNFRDSNGPMGLTSAGVQKEPMDVLPAGVDAVKIASGADHLVMLSSSGVLYTCGCAEQGQLGRVAEYWTQRGGRRGIDKLVKPDVVRVKKSKGKKAHVFDECWTGSYSTIARVKDTGELYAFGLNNYGQLGLTDNLSVYSPTYLESFADKKWRKIVGGQHHTIALDMDGNVYTLGRADYGRLGQGEDAAECATPKKVTDLSSIMDVSVGEAVSFAIDQQGVPYGWGMGTNNQLSTGDDEDVYSPIAMKSKGLAGKGVFKIDSGGQHTLLLATEEPMS